MRGGIETKRLVVSIATLGALGCGAGGESFPTTCQLAPGAAPADFLKTLGCQGDFLAEASMPLDATIPGARSVKVVLDQADGDALYFQNSVKYKIHYDFASAHLSGPDHPLVPPLASFNNEYTSTDRRFLLGAVTYYEGPKIWALELAPYDTATPEQVKKLYAAVRKATFFGAQLAFHPTSESLAAKAPMLGSIAVKSTDDIFAKIDYQPLNPGTAIGQLRFVHTADLDTTYVGFRDIVVMYTSPGDISVVAAMISEEFQTPLSHINVLAQNRGTPNMGLRHAMTNPMLRALEGKWVRLTVGLFEFSVAEVTMAEADAFWEAHKPMPVKVPPLDLTVTDLRDITGVVVEGNGVPLRDAILTGVRAFGAKAAGYSVLANTPGIPLRKAFAIPASYYVQFMQQNGFFARVTAMLADPMFRDQPAVRDAQLAQLRADIIKAPIDPAFQALLHAKLADYPNLTMRFRSSTNAEDLDGFPCAGCYDSHSGDPAKGEEDLLKAIKQTWSTVWKYRTFEERSYHGIDHQAVGMALLCHHDFPNESANGVAVTANPFDLTGLEPGFYVNVQVGGDAEVVKPPPNVTSDEFVYEFDYPGQPITFLSHSNLVQDGTTVLTREETYQLGMALDLVHKRFSPAFGPAGGNNGWYAMDVEFKFEGTPPQLFLKQARPYPGRGMAP